MFAISFDSRSGVTSRALCAYRPSTRSNGALSRNSSGRPKNSLGTLRRLARSLSTLSMPLSGTKGAALKIRLCDSTDWVTTALAHDSQRDQRAAADLHRFGVQAFFDE
jgi:hypothetical protein